MTRFAERLQSARSGERYWLSRVKLSLAAQLQDLLKQSGLNQEKYAEKLGVKPPQVSRALSGSANPTVETVVRMALSLGYVPQVTFKPLQEARRSHGVRTTESLDGIQVEITKLSSKSHAYRFDLPTADFDPKGWTVTNDERFELAG